MDVLNEALNRAGQIATPEIFNTDQGSQFTSLDFGALKDGALQSQWTAGPLDEHLSSSASGGRSLPGLTPDAPSRPNGSVGEWRLLLRPVSSAGQTPAEA